jgi:predicted PurR-regulated permease PerM
MPESAPAPNPSPQNHSIRPARIESTRFSRYFVIAVLLVTGFIFLDMVKIFFLPVMMAAVFTTLFYPMYEWLLKRFGNRKALTAFTCCVILLLGLLLPLLIVGNLVTREAFHFYQSIEAKVKDVVEKGDAGLLGDLKRSEWVRRFKLDKLDWQSTFQQFAGNAGGFLATVVSRTSGGAFVVIANVFATLFIMFYFFRDGESLILRLKYLIPLDDRHKDAIMSRFAAVSRASIKGTLFIGLAQSVIGALTLWIFGVGSPILWGFVMMVLSVIPLLGAWLVMHSAALIQILTGHVGKGIAIFLITVFIISTIDNYLRPRLVGHFTGMHDLIIFFSAIGGLATFGATGFIVGPVIAAFFVTIVDIYSIEFKTQLDLAQNNEAT